METRNRRRHHRKVVGDTARIDLGDGAQPHVCTISDVSEAGARLYVKGMKDLPESFDLMLVAGGAVRRRCRIIWRSEGQVGVQFLRPALVVSAPRYKTQARPGVAVR